MVLWTLLQRKQLREDADWLLGHWAEQTGRRCPGCGRHALVGHGRRRRTVHAGWQLVRGLRVCVVLEFLVQRVRCTGCGATHTLLPWFVARYQRHLSGVREGAMRRREAGRSWRDVLRELELPMLSATSPRRWVTAIRERLGAVTAALSRLVAAGVVSGSPHYGAVAESGTWARLEATVTAALEVARPQPQWPPGEVLAPANWLGRGEWAI